MTPEEHKKRHEILLAALDELLADFITHTGYRPSETKIMALVQWSVQQAKQPTHAEPG